MNRRRRTVRAAAAVLVRQDRAGQSAGLFLPADDLPFACVRGAAVVRGVGRWRDDAPVRLPPFRAGVRSKAAPAQALGCALATRTGRGIVWHMGTQLPQDAGPSLLRITADQLEAMAVRGAFDRLPRVELREGLLYQMNPQHFPHGIAKMDVLDALSAAVARLNLPLRAISEVSVRVSESEVPIPDVFLVQRGRYRGAVPVEQVRLVAEISDNTLADDLGRKRSLYARGGIPEYWVVDLSARVILQHWAPGGDAYAKSAVVPFGGDLASATLPGLVISTGALRDDSEGDAE